MSVHNFEGAGNSDMPPDPFQPENYFTETPYGLGVDGSTFAEKKRASTNPKLDIASLQTGDLLQVEVAGQPYGKYAIEGVDTDSLAFGSDDLLQPTVHMMIAAGQRAGERVNFSGSSVGLSMLTDTSSIIVGRHFKIISNDGIEVSEGMVSGFSVSRLGEDKQYHEVPLNQLTQTLPESPSFHELRGSYEAIKDVLSQRGFNFEDLDQDGFSVGYRKVTGDTYLYACNEGFGCAIVPQHELYAYDSNAHQLVGMRFLPTKQIGQLVVARNLTPDLFANVTAAYDANGQPDWRATRIITAPALRSLAFTIPLVTYTWQTGSEEKPKIAVDGSVAAGGSMEAYEGMSPYGIIISQESNKLSVSAVEPPYWVDDPVRYKQQETEKTELVKGPDYIRALFAGLSVDIPTDLGKLQHILYQAFSQSALD